MLSPDMYYFNFWGVICRTMKNNLELDPKDPISSWKELT